MIRFSVFRRHRSFAVHFGDPVRGHWYAMLTITLRDLGYPSGWEHRFRPSISWEWMEITPSAVAGVSNARVVHHREWARWRTA